MIKYTLRFALLAVLTLTLASCVMDTYSVQVTQTAPGTYSAELTATERLDNAFLYIYSEDSEIVSTDLTRCYESIVTTAQYTCRARTLEPGTYVTVVSSPNPVTVSVYAE